MFNYGFKCPGCGLEFDRRLPMDKRDDAICCPDCGTVAERLVYPVPHVMSTGLTPSFRGKAPDGSRIYRR
jgi:putative FmdB family regulatory protein